MSPKLVGFLKMSVKYTNYQGINVKQPMSDLEAMHLLCVAVAALRAGEGGGAVRVVARVEVGAARHLLVLVLQVLLQHAWPPEQHLHQPSHSI